MTRQQAIAGSYMSAYCIEQLRSAEPARLARVLINRGRQATARSAPLVEQVICLLAAVAAAAAAADALGDGTCSAVTAFTTGAADGSGTSSGIVVFAPLPPSPPPLYDIVEIMPIYPVCCSHCLS